MRGFVGKETEDCAATDVAYKQEDERRMERRERGGYTVAGDED